MSSNEYIITHESLLNFANVVASYQLFGKYDYLVVFSADEISEIEKSLALMK
jgi:hypothetical protein